MRRPRLRFCWCCNWGVFPSHSPLGRGQIMHRHSLEQIQIQLELQIQIQIKIQIQNTRTAHLEEVKSSSSTLWNRPRLKTLEETHLSLWKPCDTMVRNWTSLQINVYLGGWANKDGNTNKKRKFQCQCLLFIAAAHSSELPLQGQLTVLQESNQLGEEAYEPIYSILIQSLWCLWACDDEVR